MYKYYINDTYIGLKNENKGNDHYEILDELFKVLENRGFKIQIDPDTLKRYPTIAENYFYGIKDKLEFKAERYPAGFKIEFFQNFNYKNKCGGYYDFNKLSLMPYLIKLRFITELKYIKQFFIDKKYIDDSKPKFKLAEDKIKYQYVECCHHEQKDMNFNLSNLDGQTFEKYNSRDKDDKVLYNGQIKYFRRKNGLMRGKIYHNLNNMWYVILNKLNIQMLLHLNYLI